MRLEPERQLNSGKRGLPGKENNIEQGGRDRVKKLTRHKWMPTDQPEPERQLKSRKQGLPGRENSTEKGGKGGRDRVTQVH